MKKVGALERVQLDLSKEAVKDLDELKAHLGVSSRAEAVRRAIEVCYFVSKTKRNGGTLFLEEDGKQTKIVFL